MVKHVDNPIVSVDDAIKEIIEFSRKIWVKFHHPSIEFENEYISVYKGSIEVDRNASEYLENAIGHFKPASVFKAEYSTGYAEYILLTHKRGCTIVLIIPEKYNKIVYWVYAPKIRYRPEKVTKVSS